MATFQVTVPKRFNFSCLSDWVKWIQRHECSQIASGIDKHSKATQVNSLIYSMGDQADDILRSFNLSEEDTKKYAIVKDKFDSHFIKRRNMIFERAKINMRKQEDGESVDGFTTVLYDLAEHCNYGALRNYTTKILKNKAILSLYHIDCVAMWSLLTYSNCFVTYYQMMLHGYTIKVFYA